MLSPLGARAHQYHTFPTQVGRAGDHSGRGHGCSVDRGKLTFRVRTTCPGLSGGEPTHVRRLLP